MNLAAPFAPRVCPERATGGRAAVLVYGCFLFTATVGLNPLADTLAQRDAITGGGDVLRQISFTLCALGAFALAFLGAGPRPAIRSVPLVLTILVAWAWVSLAWAQYPDIAVRRLVLMTLIIASVWAFAQIFGAARLIDLTRQILGVLVVASVVAAILFAQGRHQPGEVDPALVGDWRGLFNHKNETGCVAAIAVILWLSHARRGGGIRAWLVCGMSLFLLVMSDSRSSLGFVAAALVLGGLYDLIKRLHVRRAVVLLVMATLITIGALTIISLERPIEDELNDPESLTGRVQIWSVLLDFAADHPFRGAGFGSFWNVGDLPPVIGYADNWVTKVPTGHNGYLDVLVQLGGIGLVLALLATIIVPLARIFDARLVATAESGCVAMILAFGALHNFTETSLLSSDASLWPIVLAAVCAQQRRLADHARLMSMLRRRAIPRAPATRPRAEPTGRAAPHDGTGWEPYHP